ncbi:MULTISPECIES: hypothetical protein [unclassified Ruegeria]|uniref:hypothetical protein n=1 Tax=unclassified Ruegeria TaxID=2625375 RepID=UPI0014914261|nr:MULTISPECIES: hypothetical protein [unclassified Ruegeria]NOD48709.1 hypothetical protein [Ruegeria sp. HKCCD5849]NOD51989.1 hypothetical protein [Ruegeria sp. HKCCD5851]NOD66647.1 hypothetical protein [Ruegeria sp. HKCCD7303]
MPIVRTPTEYRAALREIEYLWGSEPDTEEGRQLAEYLSAVEQFEQLPNSTSDTQGVA